MSDAGFITRISQGRKQWLKRLGGVKPYETDWSYMPGVNYIYSRCFYDELSEIMPGLSFRPCKLYHKGHLAYASPEDIEGTQNEA